MRCWWRRCNHTFRTLTMASCLNLSSYNHKIRSRRFFSCLSFFTYYLLLFAYYFFINFIFNHGHDYTYLQDGHIIFTAILLFLELMMIYCCRGTGAGDGGSFDKLITIVASGCPQQCLDVLL